MKKKFSTFLAVALLFSNAYAEDIRLEFNIGAKTAQLNGEVIEAPTYLSDKGNTMVGLRVAAQTLGITVEWEEETRTVELLGEGLTMTVVIDSDIAIVNGNEVQMTEPATILNDRTMVPIRFVSEGFGAVVEYNDEMHSVVVYSSSHNERCKLLAESTTEMISNYPSALQGWLDVTDDAVKLSDFSVIWNSIVNTKVMELFPGRFVTEELCNVYRTETGLTFDNMFKIMGISEENSDINIPIMLEVIEEFDGGYTNLVFYPDVRKIKENAQLSTAKPIQYPNFGGSGSSSSASGGGASATSEPESTVVPTETPTPQMTSAPTFKPTTEPSVTEMPDSTMKPISTEIPDSTQIPNATAVPTVKPESTKRPSQGGSAGGSVIKPKPTSVPDSTDAPGYEEPESTFDPEGEIGESPVAPPETTGKPTACPTHNPVATGEPTASPTIEPTTEPAPIVTPEPTPQITEGPSDDENHFDDVIDGKDGAGGNVILSTTESERINRRFWLPVFRKIRKKY